MESQVPLNKMVKVKAHNRNGVSIMALDHVINVSPAKFAKKTDGKLKRKCASLMLSTGVWLVRRLPLPYILRTCLRPMKQEKRHVMKSKIIYY